MSENSFWVLIPSSLYQLELEARDRELYGVLLGASAKHGFCWMSNETLAERTKTSVGSVKRSIAKLAKQHVIRLKTQKDGMRWDRQIYCLLAKDQDDLSKDQDDLSEGSKQAPTKDQDDPIVININNKLEKETPPPSTPPEKIKKPGKKYPRILLSDEEKGKLITRYEEEGLSIEDGLERFDGWAEDNPGKFKKKKSHYRCLLGWVLDACIEAEKRRLDLERSRTYLANAGRR
jgi:hypothetical protein